MLKKFSIMLFIISSLFMFGCQNEKGNNLYIGVEEGNVAFNSVGEVSREDQLTLIENLYIGLFEADGQGEVSPVLAESFTYSEDGKKMYVKIKDGFAWSDGSSVTVEDVVLGLKNNIRNQSGKYSYQYQYLDKKVEENIKVNEEGLLEISLSKSFTDFEKVLAMPIFYPILNSENPLAGPFSGDFIVEKNEKNEIVVVPQDKEKAISEKQTESIVFNYSIEKEKLVEGYKDKKYDIIFSESNLEELKGEEYVSPGVTLLWINGRSQEFNDRQGRQLIYQSLEKKPGIYPDSYRGDNKLEEISLNSKDSLGETLLDILVIDLPEEITRAEKIKEKLNKEAGINSQLVTKNLEEYHTALREGKFDLALENFEGDYHGKNAYFELFKSPLNNPLNASALNIPEINELQNQVNRIEDSPEREEIFNVLERKIIESVPAIIISEGIEKENYIQRVKNIEINSIYNYHDYSNVKY